MQYFIVEPEVAGGLGPRTVMDRSTHPPRMDRVHYVFDGWLGDSLVETFPVFLVTRALGEALRASGLTGVELAAAEVGASEQFVELYGARELPEFLWFKVQAAAGSADFGVLGDGRLVTSEAALTVLRAGGIDHAIVKELPS